MSRTRVAVVGTGYWGINHVRTFRDEPSAELAVVCDADPARLEEAKRMAPDVEATASFEDVLASDVDAVVLATTAVTHAEFAIGALDAGKHVLVEKPVSLDVASALDVAAAASRTGKTLMVGHLLLYHAAIGRLKQLIDRGDLGEIFYLYATRVNLGRLRHDESALWSFGPHDVSVILHLLGVEPVRVSATGHSYLQPGIEDVVFVTLELQGGPVAHIHLSWLDPRKERRLTVVGSQKMAVFDDVAADKLTIHDKGFERPPSFTDYADYLAIRYGDVHIPHIAMTEPLAKECRHFVRCIETGEIPRTDISSAIRVVAVLEAAQDSLSRGGSPVAVATSRGP